MKSLTSWERFTRTLPATTSRCWTAHSAAPVSSTCDARTVLAQAVSWLRAEQTGRWVIGGNGEISGNSGNGQTPVFDAGAIRRFLDMIEEHNVAWQAWFTSWGIRPHDVSYEHLDDDMVVTTRGILEFLGIDAPDRASAITAAHRRKADELNRRRIEQYQAQVPDN